MAQKIKILARKEFQSKELWSMYRLRAQVFKERMGWSVPVMSGMEIDGFDALDPYYMLISEAGGKVRGCCRLLPTEGPYMLRDTFPELLHGKPAPEGKAVWELSRFAIETDGTQHFGFADLALDSMREMVSFGDRMGIARFVIVTTTAIERLLRRAGIAITRFGPSIRIGVENSVALEINLGEQTHLALFGEVPQAA
ncbi:MAG: acyl-homoserine-lactone synthase [Sideroxydans sp.]|nr:acyl-homoserine-lactone synthase [Sideroxydans sp.]